MTPWPSAPGSATAGGNGCRQAGPSRSPPSRNGRRPPAGASAFRRSPRSRRSTWASRRSWRAPSITHSRDISIPGARNSRPNDGKIYQHQRRKPGYALNAHRVPCAGSLAPNSPLRAAAVAFGRDAADDLSASAEANPPSAAPLRNVRSPARHLWALLPEREQSRLFESRPLVCPNCGADRRIIAQRRRGRPGAAPPCPYRRAHRATADRPRPRTARLGR